MKVSFVRGAAARVKRLTQILLAGWTSMKAGLKLVTTQIVLSIRLYVQLTVVECSGTGKIAMTVWMKHCKI